MCVSSAVRGVTVVTLCKNNFLYNGYPVVLHSDDDDDNNNNNNNKRNV
jgi:hypothetical protein